MNTVLIVVFAGIAWHLIIATRRESPVFAEFRQSTSVAWWAVLFPFGPLLLLIGPRLLAAACFLPALIAGCRLIRAFDRSGTDRTKGGLEVGWKTVGAAIAGLVYVAIDWIWCLALRPGG